MGQNLVHGFLHLAEVNPFIASSLQLRSRSASKAHLHAHMPKQDGPEPLHQAAEQRIQAMGVSAFAFQGTNAHVVMGRYNLPPSTETNSQVQLVGLHWSCAGCLSSRPGPSAFMPPHLSDSCLHRSRKVGFHFAWNCAALHVCLYLLLMFSPLCASCISSLS